MERKNIGTELDLHNYIWVMEAFSAPPSYYKMVEYNTTNIEIAVTAFEKEYGWIPGMVWVNYDLEIVFISLTPMIKLEEHPDYPLENVLNVNKSI